MKFVSKYKSLKLVIKPGKTLRGNDGSVTTEPGEHIVFSNNQFQTTDQKKIVWLKNHPNFGNDFFAVKEDSVDKVAKVREQIKADDKKTK